MNEEKVADAENKTASADKKSAGVEKKTARSRKKKTPDAPDGTAGGGGADSAPSEPLAPLKTAADRIARLLCELSADSGLFVTEAGECAERKLDTKALKEFSGVLKEMSAVMTELHGDSEGASEGIRIEFSSDAMELGG